MRTIAKILSFTCPFAILICLVIGCRNTGSSVTGNESSTGTDDLSGTYNVTGTNENGVDKYAGTLVITNRGDVYQLSWDTAGKKYDGVGVRTGDAVGAAFAAGDSGEGCGVILYEVRNNATLEGKAGYWGTNSYETETAKRIGGRDLDGEYEVLGKNTGGQEYTGRLVIKPSGAGYKFTWSAGSTFEGFGIRLGDFVAVGFGGEKCGFVFYEKKVNGRLEGKWGGYGSTSVGTESAIRAGR